MATCAILPGLILSLCFLEIGPMGTTGFQEGLHQTEAVSLTLSDISAFGICCSRGLVALVSVLVQQGNSPYP